MGKTSLANIIKETLEVIGINAIVNRINCDTTDTFDSIWKKALKRIVIINETRGAGFEKVVERSALPFYEQSEEKLVPDDICNALIKSKTPVVFIFDEFDRIKDETTSGLFSDTIKTLSDNLVNGTLLLVGVADDVDGLIKGHESISRSLVEVQVPRMNSEELGDILKKACKILDMKITNEASKLLIRYSQGLPHYTHLLGRTAFRVALQKKSLQILIADVHKALKKALDDVQHSITRTYQKATSSPQKANLYKQVLLACTLAKGDDLGYFAATDVRNPLSKIMNKRYEITAFSQHLHSFCSEDRDRILIKTGTRRNFRYRFRNPLLPPFVLIRGYVDGQLTDEALEQIPIWSP